MSTELPPIGNVRVRNPYFLAPMEAVNCASFRVLCKRRGAGLVYTDMVDADYFVKYCDEFGTKEAVLKYLNPQEEEQPLAIQLGGPYIDSLNACYDAVKKYAALIDYNVGCPLGYMLGKKGGAYLMKHPDQLQKLVKGMRDHITHPLTMKIRAGWDKESINAVPIAQELEKLGIDAIAVHARTRQQRYQDKSDWGLVRKVKEKVSVPVILSGDVLNASLVSRAFSVSKCDFIMAARGAKVNPSIFSQFLKYHGEVAPKPRGVYGKESVNPFLDFSEFLHLYKTLEHRYNFSELRDHALWTATECRDNKNVTQKLMQATTEEELVRILKVIRF